MQSFNHQEAGCITKLETGIVYTTGNFITKRLWVLERLTEQYAVFAELSWSMDMVNELNCARRTGLEVMVKIKEHLFNKSFGYFEVRPAQVKVLAGIATSPTPVSKP